MNENVAAYLISLGSFGVVLCVVAAIIHHLERRESSTSPTAGAHSRRGGPAAPLFTMSEQERRRQQFTAAMARCQAELEAERRWGRISRPVQADSESAAIDQLLTETTIPRRSIR